MQGAALCTMMPTPAPRRRHCSNRGGRCDEGQSAMQLPAPAGATSTGGHAPADHPVVAASDPVVGVAPRRRMGRRAPATPARAAGGRSVWLLVLLLARPAGAARRPPVPGGRSTDGMLHCIWVVIIRQHLGCRKAGKS